MQDLGTTDNPIILKYILYESYAMYFNRSEHGMMQCKETSQGITLYT